MRVPFNDLYKHHTPLLAEINQALNAVIRESSFIRGKDVDLFEENFANLLGVKNCISCANGTDALYIAMKALDVRPGDEVIVPAHSWISTAETVTQAGGKVVFCDTLDDTYTINPQQLAELITPKTVGIIPVHLFGQAAEMGAIMEFAQNHKLWVIEDCAQAVLAEYQGRKVGTFGHAATFSFYPGKNLGAMGDAGAIVCQDSALANKMAAFARHGGLVKGTHYMEGINSRMDGLQAAVLNIKLPHLSRWTEERQSHAQSYLRGLSGLGDVRLPTIKSDNTHVWHLFVIQHPHRDELALFLKERGIGTAVNYPVCLPMLQAYEYLRPSPSDFPVATYHQSRILSLPLFPEMTEDQRTYVEESIRLFS